jgi:polycystin 2
LDGDQILNMEEQKNMIKDLMSQNEELKSAYAMLEKAQKERDLEEEKRKKRTDGVLFEDYSMLSGRIDRMEGSIASIVGKVDSVLTKLDAEEQARNEAKANEMDRENSSLGREKSAMSLGPKRGSNNQSFA